MNPSMSHEVLRLQSFKATRPESNVNVSVILLAEEGFYFDRNTNRILCFSCGFEYIPQDSRTLHHILHAANCQRRDLNKSMRNWSSALTPDVAGQDQLTFTQQNSEDDLPNSSNIQERFLSNDGTIHNSVNGHSNQILVNEQQQNTSTTHDPQQQDTSTTQDPQQQNRSITQDPQNSDRFTQSPPTIAPQAIAFSQAESVTERERVSEHSTLNISSVSYPHFSTRQARIATFATWSSGHSHRPDDFADLGFFFTGNADCVRCFCCGVGLKFWRPTDDIAYQHARLRPACAFSRLCKGQDYIDRVQQDIRGHQREPNLDHLGSSATSSPPPSTTSTGRSLPYANERPSNSAFPANGQPSPATTTNGQTSSDITTNGQTSPAVTTNGQNNSAVTTNGQNNSAVTTNGQNNSAVTTNGQPSPAVTTNIQPSPAVITIAMASLGSANGLANPSIRAHQRNSSPSTPHSTDSTDPWGSEDSGVEMEPCATAGSTPAATNGNLAENPFSRKEELRVVEREHSLLSARIKCRVCQVAPVSSISLPCGHVATCQDCADKATRCVLCNKGKRTLIKGVNSYGEY